jgi:hypothetical protein
VRANAACTRARFLRSSADAPAVRCVPPSATRGPPVRTAPRLCAVSSSTTPHGSLASRFDAGLVAPNVLAGVRPDRPPAQPTGRKCRPCNHGAVRRPAPEHGHRGWFSRANAARSKSFAGISPRPGRIRELRPLSARSVRRLRMTGALLRRCTSFGSRPARGWPSWSNRMTTLAHRRSTPLRASSDINRIRRPGLARRLPRLPCQRGRDTDHPLAAGKQRTLNRCRDATAILGCPHPRTRSGWALGTSTSEPWRGTSP